MIAPAASNKQMSTDINCGPRKKYFHAMTELKTFATNRAHAISETSGQLAALTLANCQDMTADNNKNADTVSPKPIHQP